MKKRLPYFLCIFLTAAVVLSSLFLPQAGFVLMDRQEQQKTSVEPANTGTASEDISIGSKLTAMAYLDDGYGSSLLSDVFLATGEEIPKEKLVSIIQRESAKADPLQILLPSALLDEKAVLENAQLYNVIYINGVTQSFPLWVAEISIEEFIFSFSLDARTGKIYAMKAYNKGVGTAGFSIEEDLMFLEEQDPYLYQQALLAFAAYLGYKDIALEEYTKDDFFSIYFEEESFFLSIFFTDMEISMGPHIW